MAAVLVGTYTSPSYAFETIIGTLPLMPSCGAIAPICSMPCSSEK